MAPRAVSKSHSQIKKFITNSGRLSKKQNLRNVAGGAPPVTPLPAIKILMVFRLTLLGNDTLFEVMIFHSLAALTFATA